MYWTIGTGVGLFGIAWIVLRMPKLAKPNDDLGNVARGFIAGLMFASVVLAAFAWAATLD